MYAYVVAEKFMELIEKGTNYKCEHTFPFDLITNQASLNIVFDIVHLLS